MDPVAHTLFGATLAEIGLKTKSRYATATLMIGANLPDIDAVMTVFGSDASLMHRRGMTHGVVALAVLPLLLAGGVWLWNRRKPPQPGDQQFHLPTIIGFAYLSTWSHPALDWMNTYGVRLLMPFDGRWFYGDTLFIMDPWFWLTTAAGVVMARANTRRSIAGWIVLASLASLLVLGFPAVPLVAKALWVVGVALIVGLRRRGADSTKVARVGFTLLLLHIGAVFGLARSAESALDSEQALTVQSNPAPANPFAHRVVIEYADYFEIVGEDKSVVRVEKPPRDEVVEAAMAAPSIAGFMNWTRFPIWEKRQTEQGWEVTFRDLRYVEPGGEGRGIGLVRVTLDQSLSPVE